MIVLAKKFKTECLSRMNSTLSTEYKKDCNSSYNDLLIRNIKRVSQCMDSIHLAQLPENGQMNRFDKKFIFNSLLIPELLEKSKKYYSILEYQDKRLFNYHSSYFDTPDYKIYKNHHNGKTNRYKIRIREYVDSGERFVEIKHKNSQSFMSKKRMPYHDDFPFSSKAIEFIKDNSWVDPQNLVISLITRYVRITLVNKNKDERITIDFNICVAHGDNEKQIENLAIAEIKNKDRHLRTHFNRLLKAHHIKQDSISKYCIGVAMVNNDVKNNIFKEKIRKIKKIEDEIISYNT